MDSNKHTDIIAKIVIYRTRPRGKLEVEKTHDSYTFLRYTDWKLILQQKVRFCWKWTRLYKKENRKFHIVGILTGLFHSRGIQIKENVESHVLLQR